jgi:hypothetical protein
MSAMVLALRCLGFAAMVLVCSSGAGTAGSGSSVHVEQQAGFGYWMYCLMSPG